MNLNTQILAGKVGSGENEQLKKIITPTKRKLLNSTYVTNLVPVFDVATENLPGESDSSASPAKRRKLNRGVKHLASQSD